MFFKLLLFKHPCVRNKCACQNDK